MNKYNINNTDTDGQNALHTAAINDSGRCAAILLTNGISPETKDKNGNTALHYAAEKGSQAITEMLAMATTNTVNAQQ